MKNDGISLTIDQYTDFEKLALGAFAPLERFVNEEEFISISKDFCLPNGAFFPWPIFLSFDFPIIENISKNLNRKNMSLYYDDILIGEIFPEKIFEINKEEYLTPLFGHSDINHPGVKRFLSTGKYFVSGKINLITRIHFPHSNWELTPHEMKQYFFNKKWKRITCFASRNVPHRGHEYLQRIALEISDGLLIHITTPPKTPGAYRPEAIHLTYDHLIKNYYGRDRAILSFVSTTFRGAGPREALLQAIMKKNYGCTDFIIGRDHSGVGNFYELYAGHDMADRFREKLGINILKLFGPYFCKTCSSIVTERTCHHSNVPDLVVPLKSTYLRESKSLPEDYIIRREFFEILKHLDPIY